MRKRNGKIELMRFLFCVSIVIYHINKSMWGRKKVLFWRFTPARNGFIGVEFFFVVSGFLLAQTIYRHYGCGAPSVHRERETVQAQPIADETLHFLWRKIKGLLPYHFFYSFLMLLLMIPSLDTKLLVKRVISYIPGLFFLYGTGLSSSFFLNIEWYLSCMLIAFAIIYPLCRKYYINFTHLFGPLFALMLLGYLSLNIGSLGGVKLVSGLTRHCTNRALAEITLGTTCFEISRWLKGKTFSTPQRLLFSLTEAGCYFCTFVYIYTNLKNQQYDFYILLLLCVAVTISFSQCGLLGTCTLFENRVCDYLGAISMPIFLFQVIPIYFASVWMTEMAEPKRFGLTLVAVLAGAILTYHLWLAVERALARRKTKAARS